MPEAICNWNHLAENDVPMNILRPSRWTTRYFANMVFHAKEIPPTRHSDIGFPDGVLKAMFPETKSWRSVKELLAKQSRGWVVAEALVLLIFVGFIDYITGYEVTIFPFYSIPILFAMWLHGRNLAIVISILSTFSWLWGDIASHHPYSQEWYQIWDAIVRWIFFLLVMVSGSAVRHQRDAHRARIELLRGKTPS